MQTDPTLYTKSMMAQMRSLIIHSFRKLSESIELTPTVIIDGLDECDGHKMHQLILEIIYEVDAMHKLPPRFLITSCPDSQSHTFARRLTTQTLRTITQRIVFESLDPNQDINQEVPL